MGAEIQIALFPRYCYYFAWCFFSNIVIIPPLSFKRWIYRSDIYSKFSSSDSCYCGRCSFIFFYETALLVKIVIKFKQWIFYKIVWFIIRPYNVINLLQKSKSIPRRSENLLHSIKAAWSDTMIYINISYKLITLKITTFSRLHTYNMSLYKYIKIKWTRGNM